MCAEVGETGGGGVEAGETGGGCVEVCETGGVCVEMGGTGGGCVEVGETGERCVEMGERGGVSAQEGETGGVCVEVENGGGRCARGGEQMGETGGVREEEELGCSGAAEAVEMMEQEAGWSPVPSRLRSRNRAGPVKAKKSRQTGRRAGGKAGQPDSSDTEECESNEGDLQQENFISLEDKSYSPRKMKTFLQEMKTMKGVNIEHYFQDKQQFYLSARRHVKNKAEAGLTDQEVFRLKKLILKVRRKLE